MSAFLLRQQQKAFMERWKMVFFPLANRKRRHSFTVSPRPCESMAKLRIMGWDMWLATCARVLGLSLPFHPCGAWRFDHPSCEDLWKGGTKDLRGMVSVWLRGPSCARLDWLLYHKQNSMQNAKMRWYLGILGKNRKGVKYLWELSCWLSGRNLLLLDLVFSPTQGELHSMPSFILLGQREGFALLKESRVQVKISWSLGFCSVSDPITVLCRMYVYASFPGSPWSRWRVVVCTNRCLS